MASSRARILGHSLRLLRHSSYIKTAPEAQYGIRSMIPQLHILEQRVQDWYNIFYTLRIFKLDYRHYYELASRGLEKKTVLDFL